MDLRAQDGVSAACQLFEPDFDQLGRFGSGKSKWIFLHAQVFGTQVHVMQTRPSVPCAYLNPSLAAELTMQRKLEGPKHVLQCRQVREVEEAVAKAAGGMVGQQDFNLRRGCFAGGSGASSCQP